MKVLLVEDDFLMRQLAQSLLKKLGADVWQACDGQEALTLLPAGWDLVLMDCQMPILNGLEATRQWREIEKRQGNGSHTPIVALTGATSQSEREECLGAGMDGFVSKPLKLDSLRELLEKWERDQLTDREQSINLPSSTRVTSSVNTAMDDLVNEYRGFEPLLQQLTSTYSSDWLRTIQSLRTAIEQANASEVFQLAHKFKGQAQTLRCASIAQLLEPMEKAAQAGDLTESLTLLARLDNEVQLALPQLRQLIQRLSSGKVNA